MTQLYVPNVMVKGAGFREKVRLAIVEWARRWPHEMREYKEYCKARRAALPDKAAHWNGEGSDKSIVEYFRYPPRVPEMLGMTEMGSKIMYGVPFGTGNPRWHFDTELDAIFMQEVCDGFISSFRGGTEEDNKRTPE